MINRNDVRHAWSMALWRISAAAWPYWQYAADTALEWRYRSTRFCGRPLSFRFKCAFWCWWLGKGVRWRDARQIGDSIANHAELYPDWYWPSVDVSAREHAKAEMEYWDD